MQIRIEEDLMYISNCSMLPFGWTAETLLGSHTSKPYNPDIARVFYRAGYIESWGRGIQKIRDACKTLGAAEPEYMVHGEDIMVKFRALQSAKVTDMKTANRQSGGLNGAYEVRILEVIEKNRFVTQSEIAEVTGISLRTVQRVVKLLRENGKIERKGAKRNGYWEIIENRNRGE